MATLSKLTAWLVNTSQAPNQKAHVQLCSDTNTSCPLDYPREVVSVTPECLKPNDKGKRYCALYCTYGYGRCPWGARCRKVIIPDEEKQVASRDKTLQNNYTTTICMYDSDSELAAELLLDE